MTRYDIYDQQLNPGDHICCLMKTEVVAARIHSISLRGTIRIGLWRPEHQTYSHITQQIRGYRIIKIAGMPVQTY